MAIALVEQREDRARIGDDQRERPIPFSSSSARSLRSRRPLANAPTLFGCAARLVARGVLGDRLPDELGGLTFLPCRNPLQRPVIGRIQVNGGLLHMVTIYGNTTRAPSDLRFATCPCLGRQPERDQLAAVSGAADRHDDVLPAVQHVGHRRAGLRRGKIDRARLPCPSPCRTRAASRRERRSASGRNRPRRKSRASLSSASRRRRDVRCAGYSILSAPVIANRVGRLAVRNLPENFALAEIDRAQLPVRRLHDRQTAARSDPARLRHLRRPAPPPQRPRACRARRALSPPAADPVPPVVLAPVIALPTT